MYETVQQNITEIGFNEKAVKGQSLYIYTTQIFFTSIKAQYNFQCISCVTVKTELKSWVLASPCFIQKN